MKIAIVTCIILSAIMLIVLPFIVHGFFKSPNVYDTVGILGLILAVMSILLAIADVNKRIKQAVLEASEESQKRLVTIFDWLTYNKIIYSKQYLDQAKTHLHHKSWPQAGVYLVICQGLLIEAQVNQSSELQSIVANISDYIKEADRCLNRDKGVFNQNLYQNISKDIIKLHELIRSMNPIINN